MREHPLDTPIKFVKGVGPVRAAQFESLGVRTAGELLEHIPFRYELMPRSRPIGDVELDETATVVGTIERVRSSGGYRRASITATVVDGTGKCLVRWFNSSYLRDKLGPGLIIRLTGKVETDEKHVLFVNPTFRLIPDDEDPLSDDRDMYCPVYSGTGNLTSTHIARAVRALREKIGNGIGDFLPAELVEKRELPSRRSAISGIHAPASMDEVPRCRKRLAYDEFLLMQLAIQLRRHHARQVNDACPISTTGIIDQRIRARLPFSLTDAQDRAVKTIVTDLNSNKPMARLLQGDVGSGKTAVAIYTALTTIANRCQVGLLSPTEILAQQTYEKFCQYLQGSRVRVELLVGKLPRKDRELLLDRLARGDVDLLVGTHALIQEDVRFRNLGLVIVDEQHRFGVTQRGDLRSKGRSPHYLVMTATPIPRTLAMTVHGDLDVAVIDELPPGRQEIQTRLVASDETGQAWVFVRERLKAGEQAYVVYPLVEESETLELKAAATEVERLGNGELKGFSLGLLHGRMDGNEKKEVIDRFRSGRIQVLVSTTVIEVGVDVPNATIMIVEHAERYGLSQLHQLRGRTGRGDRQSYCLLFSDYAGKLSRERLGVLCATTDGFRIAEADLKIRGPGELVGRRQHGLPEFKAADLVEDLELREQSAAEIVERLPVSEVEQGPPVVLRGEADNWKPWFPAIDFDRCTNCRQCLSFCLFDVYGTDADGKIRVKNPKKCKNDCPACSRVCPEVAIIFPKYSQGPINGDEVSPEDAREEPVKVDLSSLVSRGIHSSLGGRGKGKRKRFSLDRGNDDFDEDCECHRILQGELGIPDTVISQLTSEANKGEEGEVEEDGTSAGSAEEWGI